MREIKFRAWDTDELEMLFSDPLDDYERSYSWFYGLEDRDVNGSVILMQFTGLHDKNGNEIYEGDILRTDEVGEDKQDLIVRFGDGEYDGGYYKYVGFYLDSAKKDGYAEGFNEAFDKDIEVVGNVYENPELLEKA